MQVGRSCRPCFDGVVGKRKHEGVKDDGPGPKNYD